METNDAPKYLEIRVILEMAERVTEDGMVPDRSTSWLMRALHHSILN